MGKGLCDPWRSQGAIRRPGDCCAYHSLLAAVLQASELLLSVLCGQRAIQESWMPSSKVLQKRAITWISDTVGNALRPVREALADIWEKGPETLKG